MGHLESDGPKVAKATSPPQELASLLDLWRFLTPASRSALAASSCPAGLCIAATAPCAQLGVKCACEIYCVPCTAGAAVHRLMNRAEKCLTSDMIKSIEINILIWTLSQLTKCCDKKNRN